MAVNKKLKHALAEHNKARSEKLEAINGKYFADYDNEPIGGGNPYYRCVHCKVSDPQINGRIEGHLSHCEYRIQKEKELGLS